MTINETLSAFSKDANYLLGDRSGRTISTRTANGFQEISPATVEENNAVHIAHGAMVVTFFSLFSKNNIIKLIGFILGLILLFCYLIGKR